MSSIPDIMIKLSNAGVNIQFNNLPSDKYDSIWEKQIKPHLTPDEFSVLKNARCFSATTTSTQGNYYYLNICKI